MLKSMELLIFIASLLVISGGSLRTAVGLSLNLQRDYVRERAIEGETWELMHLLISYGQFIHPSYAIMTEW